MKSLKFLFPLLFGVLFGIQGAQAQEPDCSDTWTDAAEGSFEDGFTFAFTFADGDLTLDVELLDEQVGLVAFAQTTNPDFVETMMNNEGGQAFSLTFPNQTAGDAFNVAVKFAFAGGLVTSTTLNYEVGANCDVLGGGGGNDDGIALPITFEEDIDYGIVDFGDFNSSEIVTDPTDPSNTVVQSTKGAGGPEWAGTTVAEGIGFAEPLPFEAGSTTMTVRVWSPVADIPVRLKVENLTDAGVSVETEATVTEAEVWQTLTFDFANQAAGTAEINFASVYTKASIFFDFGTPGNDNTYFWDDVAFGDGGEPAEALELPITFEEDIDYGLVDFEGTTSEIVADPTDPENTVVQTLKGDGSPFFAGTTVAEDIGFAEALPFEEGATTMTIRVWSPTADIPVRLKVENLTDPTVSVETEATTSVAEEWETLTFDFANQAGGTAALNFASVYTKATIFFNFGTDGQGLTYYWDDVAFGDDGEPAEAIELPITFEEDIDYGLVDFEGTTSEIVADPTDPENTVVQTLKGDGSPFFAGTTVAENIGFAEPLPFEEGATTMTIRVWSPTAAIPVRLKVENLTDPTVSVETEATTTVSEEWETLTFDFANQAGGTAALNFASVYTKATIFFNFGTDGQGLTYYWDDVTFGEGDITEPAEPLVLPITFEEDIEYGLADFEGANSEIVTDPTDSENIVIQTVKGDGSPFFAGTTVGDGIGFAEPLPFEEGATTMTVRVWSPTADIPVRLKVENLTDPTVSVETEATTTVAEEWETLTFDFANQAEGTAALNFASVYTKASIFFNFGTDGQGLTYFWDDVAFGGEAPEPTTVWDIISGSPDHTTLATVLELTGLDAALQGEGPFTVFAPTDAAFAAVDPDYIDELLADPAGDLTEVLLYHVLGAAVFSGDLSDGQTAETLQGESIEVSIDGGNVFINDAQVTVPDLEADNGVLHIINGVLLPPSFTISTRNIADANNPAVLAPNPAAEFFNLQFAAPLTEMLFVSVYDLSGRLVKSLQVNGQQTRINTSDLAAGTYVLTIREGDVQYSQKLMIAR